MRVCESCFFLHGFTGKEKKCLHGYMEEGLVFLDLLYLGSVPLAFSRECDVPLMSLDRAYEETDMTV